VTTIIKRGANAATLGGWFVVLCALLLMAVWMDRRWPAASWSQAILGTIGSLTCVAAGSLVVTVVRVAPLMRIPASRLVLLAAAVVGLITCAAIAGRARVRRVIADQQAAVSPGTTAAAAQLRVPRVNPASVPAPVDAVPGPEQSIRLYPSQPVRCAPKTVTSAFWASAVIAVAWLPVGLFLWFLAAWCSVDPGRTNVIVPLLVGVQVIGNLLAGAWFGPGGASSGAMVAIGRSVLLAALLLVATLPLWSLVPSSAGTCG
jgi:hypothetical protein